MTTFKDMPVSPAVLRVLEKLGFTVPTEIQKKAIPLLLSVKKIDFHGQAQTGTGKTLAFGIPLLEKIDKTRKVPQGLVIAPTRELAVQTYESMLKVSQEMGITIAVIYGGASLDEQIRTIRRGVQIIIGTPGRIHDHLRRKTLDFKTIETLVLDEADIMLDMGFKEEIEDIMKFLPKDRQIWLFSATVKSGIADIMKKHMKETVSIKVAPSIVSTPKTIQYYSIVPFRSRLHAITRFIQSAPDFYGFIFCQTKMLTGEVAEELVKRGYNVAALHGDLSQGQRNAVIKKFKSRENTILVATDVAARGIDVPDITHVINYSIPEDLESYVHRIGRTGRAGKEGIAITFISRTEQRVIQSIERKFGFRIQSIDVPSVGLVVKKRIEEIPTYIENLESRKISYSTDLEKVIEALSPAHLKQVTIGLLYDSFLAKLDLEDVPYVHVDNPSFSATNQFQEIYLDVGSDDGVTNEDVRNYLLQTPVIKPDQIQTIRVIKRRSFVKLSSDCSPDLVSSLRGKKLLDGRPVRVNVTCLIEDNNARSGGRQRDQRGEQRGGDRGGYRRRR